MGTLLSPFLEDSSYQKLLNQPNLDSSLRLRLLASCALAASHVDMKVAKTMLDQLPSIEEGYGSMEMSLEDLEGIISQRNFMKPRKASIEACWSSPLTDGCRSLKLPRK